MTCEALSDAAALLEGMPFEYLHKERSDIYACIKGERRIFFHDAPALLMLPLARRADVCSCRLGWKGWAVLQRVWHRLSRLYACLPKIVWEGICVGFLRQALIILKIARLVSLAELSCDTSSIVRI